jgi:hypothetical protein
LRRVFAGIQEREVEHSILSRVKSIPGKMPQHEVIAAKSRRLPVWACFSLLLHYCMQ